MKNKRTRTLLFIGLGLAIVLAGSVFIIKNQTSSSESCEPTEHMKASNFYDVPCSILFTVKGSPLPSRSEVQKIIEPTDGELEAISVESGIYALTVKPGSEKAALDYLHSRPEVNSASRNRCCAVTN